LRLHRFILTTMASNSTAATTLKPPQLVWLVTGTSSGFGTQFVHSIIARGDRVIATARALDKIKHLEAAGANVLRLDLTDSEEEIA
jgi:NADP-dependent 3-hydroxy acid dehydrogenase YdfG